LMPGAGFEPATSRSPIVLCCSDPFYANRL